MDKNTAEKIIAANLSVIRAVVVDFLGEDGFDVCSMYVTPHSESAWVIDDEHNYILHHDLMDYDEAEGEQDE